MEPLTALRTSFVDVFVFSTFSFKMSFLSRSIRSVASTQFRNASLLTASSRRFATDGTAFRKKEAGDEANVSTNHGVIEIDF